jgi:hypothetical protein
MRGHHISAVLGLYINSMAPLHIRVRVDRPIGALVLGHSVCAFLLPLFMVPSAHV